MGWKKICLLLPGFFLIVFAETGIIPDSIDLCGALRSIIPLLLIPVVILILVLFFYRGRDISLFGSALAYRLVILFLISLLLFLVYSYYDPTILVKALSGVSNFGGCKPLV